MSTFVETRLSNSALRLILIIYHSRIEVTQVTQVFCLFKNTHLYTTYSGFNSLYM